jgi:2-polyprenyl-3-methyl-5-hydroxy-6-metoxy-1,4-benzoquinol methylase
MRTADTVKLKSRLKRLNNSLMQLFGKRPAEKNDPGPVEPNEIDLIRNKGERATHLHRNDTFVAHLSIYDFAVQFSSGLEVIDAGSGSGYGSAYLAENGAKRVIGLELDSYAVEFSKQNFGTIPNLTYQQMNLESIHGFEENEFDIIFSSNVLEHVPDVHSFLSEAAHILRPSGKLVLAVPPIDNAARIMINVSNHYHVNIWSINQWLHTLQQYFEEIVPYSHNYIGRETYVAGNKPEESKITVADFAFKEYSVSAGVIPTMTAVFVASCPKKQLVAIDKKMIDFSFNVNLPGPVKYNKRGILCSDVTYDTQTTVGRLKAGIKYCQTFICNEDYLCGIALQIATYHKQIDSMLKLTLLDEKKNVIREAAKNTLDIPDNFFYPFLFDSIPDSKGRLYTFCIETIQDKGETVSLRTDSKARSVCTRDGEPVSLALVYKSCFKPEG